ncbi:Crp/Fnr family transcriptional regulator [Streptomyces gibsoniae]|uniref:Cyclic nucleotide-binding domain-containing protein n=1 Tax=Streptomyces gibsoniae TaxID=3075529 RepID=A0ABU2U2H3_9ACTN|nr:cyclic nucleotide-binding domain-containing protein [Streptomyces sp. DSM 41699]MDT0467423.1 cyclic nucleotide-binding domain-containing protein [Streptomyces sp. DSM 41699]
MVGPRTGVFGALTKDHREQLISLAREVSFETGERIFNEGAKADRFWIIHTGTVALDLHVPGRRPVVVETLGAGQMLGWSWFIPPQHWHLGAEAGSPVRAYEFDAAAVRELCKKDPAFDHALCIYIAGVIADRLRAARVRLLDLYAPYGAGDVP